MVVPSALVSSIVRGVFAIALIALIALSTTCAVVSIPAPIALPTSVKPPVGLD